MSNSQITSQLTRVTVPSISDGKFADGIRNAFETINNNFKTIASLPFIQGVQGDSYTLISKDIWVEVDDKVLPVHYALTKEGAVLLNSIFESVIDNTDDAKKFHEGDSFDECKTNILSDLSLNGVSPLDSFFTEKIEEDKTVKELVNNKLYFYSVINNLNEEQDTYLGQYFYFLDARITELGSVYGSEGLSDFNDFTGFYQYQPASDTEAERYNAISIVPNLYYDKYKDDICWKYNGQETGISAIGPKGLDGKDANFKIVYVQDNNVTNNSGDILGYYGFNENGGQGGIIYDVPVQDCFCLIQFVSTTNENGKIEIAEYVDSAFGEVHSNKAYWEDEYRISKLFNNQNITRYFCSMGATSSIENHPYYFAIPAYLDRSDAITDNYKVGHVFCGSTEGKLFLQKADNAFTESGGQTPLNDLSTNNSESEFDIQNYNVKIAKDLSVDGTTTINDGAIINSGATINDGAIINSGATINDGAIINSGATIKNGLVVNGENGSTGLIVYAAPNGIGAYIEGGRNRTSGCTGLVVKGGLQYGSSVKRGLGIKVENCGAEIDEDLSIGGTLSVTSDATIGGTLSVTGKATIENDLSIGGTLSVTGKATIENDLSIGGTLSVTSDATIGGTLSVTGKATFDEISVDGEAHFNDDLFINSDLDVNGTTNINNLDVTGTVTIENDLSVGGTLGVYGSANFNETVNIIGTSYDVSSHPGLIVEGGNGGKRVGQPGGIGLIVRGGTYSNSNDEIITSLGLKVETGGALIDDDLTIGGTLGVSGKATLDDDLTVGKRLVVNYGGTNSASSYSEIYGYDAYGGTSNGGTGLVVYGGSGGETGVTAQGNGGVGLIVRGGTAGDFTGSVEHAGTGGTGLVVYGGSAGAAGSYNTGHVGDAIKTYGKVVIGDIDGKNITKISSNSTGLNIDKNIVMQRKSDNGPISLINVGNWSDLDDYYDISGDSDDSVTSHISISYSDVNSINIKNGRVGRGLISLYATGNQGTTENYSVTITDCPKNSIICFGVKIQNPSDSNQDLDNVTIYVQNGDGAVKQYCGDMGVIKSGKTEYRGFVTYVV